MDSRVAGLGALPNKRDQRHAGMLAKLLARHLRTPAGWIGRVVALLMNAGNREMNLAAIQALSIEPAHRVLEVGFGGGVALADLLACTPQGRVAGLELSPTMLRRARRQFRVAIAQGRLQLEQGAIDHMPFPDASFDRVLSVNTIYFWPDPLSAVRELRRVLAPAGRLVLGYRTPAAMANMPPTRYGFRIYEAAEVESLLRSAGFQGVVSKETGAGGHAFIVTQAAVSNLRP
jgi:SAM-dependent methyltransferase